MEIHSESANLEGKFRIWILGSRFEQKFLSFFLLVLESSSPRALGSRGPEVSN